MIAPAVITVALRTAILALIFPAVFRAMLHAELPPACWVLADQRLAIRALAATEAMAIRYPARPCLKLFATPLVCTFDDQAFSAGQSSACYRAKLVYFPC
jgi:hypothetical protein